MPPSKPRSPGSSGTHTYVVVVIHGMRALSDPNTICMYTYTHLVHRTLASGGYTVPSTVGEELTFNPFMRVQEPAVVAAAQKKGGAKKADPATVMSALREMKNSF